MSSLPKIIILLLLGASLVGAESPSPRPISVTIDYGDERPLRTVEASYLPGATALSVLRDVARVRTRRVAAYTFVSSVDGLASKPGSMGWFYTLDGVSAKTTADTTPLEAVRAMRWEYRVEACY